MSGDKHSAPISEKLQHEVTNIQTHVGQAVDHAHQEVVRSHEPWYKVSRRGGILIGIYFTVFALFSVLAFFVHASPIISIDVAITHEFQENHEPWLQTFMTAVSLLGNYSYIFTALVILTALAFWIVGLRLEGLFIAGLSGISELLNELLKLLISRPRPTSSLVEILTQAHGLSFPSGHVMSYVAYWGLLLSFGIILFKRDRWWHYFLLIIPALFVILVGPSRIYLGAHWASDVLGGYLFGGLLLGLALSLYLRLKSAPEKWPAWLRSS